MPSAEQATRIYRELAEDYGRQGQAQMRDRFLVLAADAALAAGQDAEAERLRSRLLQHNPHHLLKPYNSFAEAMKSADVQNYVSALRRSHPYEKAENLLEGLRQSGEHGVSPSKPQLKTSPELEVTPHIALSAGEELKVFRVADTRQEPKASPSRPAAHVRPPSPSASPPPARPPQSSQAPPSARPSGAEEILPLRREPYPTMDKLRPGPAEREEHDPTAGGWVATGLFLLALLLGILLGAYTLIRPFLPRGWF
jgi:hypothetical protein